ncbi:MAG: GNAT family N-acetyltransferase [Phycisphaeraceae bacterium JB051]
MAYHAEHDPYFAITDNSDQYFVQHLQTHISSRQAKVYVAVIDRQIVGYIMAKIEQRPPIFVHRRFGMISDLAVSADVRRQGIGRLLTEHVLTWFKSRKIDRAELILLAANPLSTRFWEAMDFKLYCARLFREI